MLLEHTEGAAISSSFPKESFLDQCFSKVNVQMNHLRVPLHCTL